jgi:pimeloyl-ACP methyl ester carboxylesterase
MSMIEMPLTWSDTPTHQARGELRTRQWPGRTRDHGEMEVSRGDGSAIAVEVAGPHGGRPVLFCHGLADARLSVQLFGPAARELGLRLVAPDRPGIGRTDPRALRRLADWAEDAALVLDAAAARPAALLGISAGGPFAAACAARLPGRVRSLTLIAPLGAPGWPTRGMAPGQRLALQAARRAPAFGGWFLGRLAVLARRSPRLFLRLATSELPGIDRRALARPGLREAFLAGYRDAFRQGSRGVAQDLRVLMRPWGFELGSITVPASIHHGTADTTVPPRHARLFAAAIPGAQLQLHPGHGHFSILADARQILAPLAA